MRAGSAGRIGGRGYSGPAKLPQTHRCSYPGRTHSADPRGIFAGFPLGVEKIGKKNDKEKKGLRVSSHENLAIGGFKKRGTEQLPLETRQNGRGPGATLASPSKLQKNNHGCPQRTEISERSSEYPGCEKKPGGTNDGRRNEKAKCWPNMRSRHS